MKIFVSNINFAADEEELTAFLGDRGFAPLSVKILLDRETGNSRGFGFVEFADSDEGNRAIKELHGEDFQYRRLNVSEARPEVPRRREPVERYERRAR